MKKGVLFLSVFLLLLTLSGCKDNIGKHEKTLGSYDNYVLTLNKTVEFDGVPQSSKVYYYVDNDTNQTCITTFNPINLKDKNDTGETPFGCIGIQLEIGGEQYFHDGLKAYIFADASKTNIQDIFFAYFDVDDFTEEDGKKVYSLELTIGDLEHEMKQIIGVSSVDESSIEDSEVIISAVYSTDEKRFLEFTVSYVDYLENVYTLLGNPVYISEAYTTFTYGHFDKKYSISKRVPISEIDDYPDSLGTAELVGYTIIEDTGSIDANFLDSNDSDIFQFDASGPNQYTIGIDVSNNEIVEFTIADFNGAVVQYGVFDAVQGYTTTLELVSEGTYYIVINPADGTTVPFDYTINVD